MLSATVVADGHQRVLPLMPAFVQPQQDPAADRPELSEAQRKQDCERNAAKRWLPAHTDELRPYRPVFLGDNLYCCQPLCRLVGELGADFLFVCKPSPHKRLYELLHDDFIHSSGWIKTRNRHKQVERQRFRWMNGLPIRDSDAAVMGAWVEFAIERHGERTYTNTFFTSLQVTADNMAAIARARSARRKIENEGFNCLVRHGYYLKRNFGHGGRCLPDLFTTLNLFAFVLHAVLDCVSELWRQGRAQAGTCRKFFVTLGFLTKLFCFGSWAALLETVARKRPPPFAARAAARAMLTPPASQPASGSCRRPRAQMRLAGLATVGLPGFEASRLSLDMERASVPDSLHCACEATAWFGKPQFRRRFSMKNEERTEKLEREESAPTDTVSKEEELDFEFDELESRIAPSMLPACGGCSGCSNSGCSQCG